MDGTSHYITTTPKRKRTDVASEEFASQVNTFFSFEASHGLHSDGGDSPSTKVAHRFQGLDLADSRGGAAAADGRLCSSDKDPGRNTDDGDSGRMEIDKDESKVRKRLKPTPPSLSSDGSPKPKPRPQPPVQPRLLAKVVEIPETPIPPKREPNIFTSSEPRRSQYDGNVLFKPSAPFVQSVTDNTVMTAGAANVSQDIPSQLHPPAPDNSSSSLEIAKSRGRKRADTPPFIATTIKPGNSDQSGDPVADAFDPVRAALTWHEDEITVYDPEDKDDDGVGINGIGFKPTPAIAHARTMKRKQQLAEYKKREEREARARRSSRRRGSPDRTTKLLRKEAASNDSRKVRFTDSESTAMITI